MIDWWYVDVDVLSVCGTWLRARICKEGIRIQPLPSELQGTFKSDLDLATTVSSFTSERSKVK